MLLMAFVSLQPYFMWDHTEDLLRGSHGDDRVRACGALSVAARRSGAGLAVDRVFTVSPVPHCAAQGRRQPYHWLLLIPFTVRSSYSTAVSFRSRSTAFLAVRAFAAAGDAAVGLDRRRLADRAAVHHPARRHRAARIPPNTHSPARCSCSPTALSSRSTLFRLCGIYDEPGTVGTIAALCLAARRLPACAAYPGAIAFAGGLDVVFGGLCRPHQGLGLFADRTLTKKRPLALVAVLGSVADRRHAR